MKLADERKYGIRVDTRRTTERTTERRIERATEFIICFREERGQHVK